jgi:phosphatidylglycerol:prolipoprotein diacylglycerol transferase
MYPYLIKLGPLTVGTYGVMLAIAFLTVTLVMRYEFHRKGFKTEWTYSIIFTAVISGIIGARIYFVLEHLLEFFSDPLAMIFSGGGLTWYGGFIAGFIAVVWKINKLPVPNLELVDTISPLLLLGYGIGRIGCLLSGDGDYGPPTNLPWGMAFPTGLVPTEVPVHPTPIYESLLSIILFVILWKLRKHVRIPGLMVIGMLIFYGFERFVTEFWRLTPKVLWGWMSMAQILSLIVMAGGMVWGFYRINKFKSLPLKSENEQNK